MLTRHEILSELRRIGVKEPSMLKIYFKDFENYLRTNHGLKITTTKAESGEEIFKKNSPLFK
jgi:hypothetical protein